MKKVLLPVLLMLAVVLLLTACKAPELAAEEPTATLTVEPTPLYVPWTPDPTVTPRPMGDVETPAPGATPLLIDPMDKPTRPPLGLDKSEGYEEVVADLLDIKFKVPNYYIKDTVSSSDNVIVYREPDNDIRSGQKYPATLTITRMKMSSAQTESDAERHLETAVNQLREAYEGMEVSALGTGQSILGEKGVYYTLKYDQPIGGSEETERMRARFAAVAKGTNIYLIHNTCPIMYNSDYDEVYKKVRASLEEL